MNPLFFPDYSTLLLRLRLQNTSTPGVVSMIEGAMEEVRIGFYERMSESRITEITGTAYTSDPSTAADRLRMKAGILEFKWVRLILRKNLPSVFLDTANETRLDWNENPIARESRMSEKQYREELSEILSGIADLEAGDSSLGSTNVSVIGPDNPKSIGHSIGFLWRKI